jgi:hypothetical protein
LGNARRSISNGMRESCTRGLSSVSLGFIGKAAFVT